MVEEVFIAEPSREGRVGGVTLPPPPREWAQLWFLEKLYRFDAEGLL